MLLLTSDGVHDILSDSYMEEAIKDYMSLPSSIVYKLVFDSLNHQEEISDDALERIENITGTPLHETDPGKDNATAVLVLTKNIKR